MWYKNNILRKLLWISDTAINTTKIYFILFSFYVLMYPQTDFNFSLEFLRQMISHSLNLSINIPAITKDHRKRFRSLPQINLITIIAIENHNSTIVRPYRLTSAISDSGFMKFEMDHTGFPQAWDNDREVILAFNFRISELWSRMSEPNCVFWHNILIGICIHDNLKLRKLAN